MAKHIRILMVEDYEDDAELLLMQLKRSGYSVTSERVETAAAMAKALSTGEWDLVICDYNLPNFGALQALELMQKKGLDLPFLIVSGAIGEDVAVSAMKAGAHDYIMKNNLTRLIPAIEREIKEAEIRKERKALEEENKRQEASILSAIIKGQDEERRRISGELHDGVGQIISAAVLNFNAIEANFKIGKMPTEDSLQNLGNLLNEVFHEIRNLSHRLSPRILEENGLKYAIEKLCHKVNSANRIIIEFQALNLAEHLDKDIEINLYRIVQELISNVIKHAEAQTLSIQISCFGDELVLMATDDGKGFDVLEAKARKGIGLSNLDARVKHLNGLLSIESSPNRGSTVHIVIPLAGQHLTEDIEFTDDFEEFDEEEDEKDEARGEY